MHTRGAPDEPRWLKARSPAYLICMRELRLNSTGGFRKFRKNFRRRNGNSPHVTPRFTMRWARLVSRFFNVRYPLVDGQKVNFGNIDGDNPPQAAYTEAR